MNSNMKCFIYFYINFHYHGSNELGFMKVNCYLLIREQVFFHFAIVFMHNISIISKKWKNYVDYFLPHIIIFSLIPTSHGNKSSKHEQLSNRSKMYCPKVLLYHSRFTFRTIHISIPYICISYSTYRESNTDI